MRRLSLILLLWPMALHAQDAKRFARAVQQRTPHALDRWMKHELHAQRKGVRINNPGSSYVVHAHTYDSFTAWLRQQPGVVDAGWDRCIAEIDLWPGRSTIAVRVRTLRLSVERCFSVQEGRPGTIKLFGWRPRVRKSREELKWLGARECIGFVEAQRKACAELRP